MKNWKSNLNLNKQEQRGIFFLFLGILLLQFISFLLGQGYLRQEEIEFRADVVQQQAIDALKRQSAGEDSLARFPFNPNFISDFKGYTLGMSVAEIDRLHAYRAGKQFVHSAVEFQEVTGISDSLLGQIAPFFRFPDWSRTEKKAATGPSANRMGATATGESESKVLDLNTATAEALQSIRGIGTVLSHRIVRFRDALGGFMDNGQLNDVYGLDPEVALRTLKTFRVLEQPKLPKINLNTASAKDIARLIYIPYPVAMEIVAYREQVGRIGSFNEIAHLEGFPSEKIDRIKLYLTL